MYKIKYFSIGFFWIAIGCHISVQAQTKKQPVDYVDNRIGVIDKISNCVIGPQLPSGSISPSPQTQNGEDDGYSPFEPIRGFGQLHVSGTGWGTNGQIFISPQIGLAVGEKEHDSPKTEESAKPYEYAVKLNRYNIGVAFTPSYHSAIYKFTFPKSSQSHLLLDITHALPGDIKPVIKGEVSMGEVHFDDVNHQSFSGSGRYKGGFAASPYTIYYAVKISKKPREYGTWLNGKINTGSVKQALVNKNDRVGAFVKFATQQDEVIYLKVSISYKSIDQAKQWLNQEIPDWNYETAKQKARNTWNSLLKKIEVEGGTPKEKTIFYTAFYHANLMPRNRTNDTEAFGKDVPMWDDHFAVWDTWRTLYPLHALINHPLVSGTVNSFIARYKKYGKVKDAFVNGNDMDAEQGGNNIDNIIADAYVKKVPGINWDEAYKLLKHDADNGRLGSFGWKKEDSASNTYKKLGWVVPGIMNVSMSLEYSYNDYCTALVAKGLGKQDDYANYLARSKQWINLWNKDAESDGYKGFIMPKALNGDFIPVDLKAYPGSWKNYFYEASSWNYSWFMPHQFKELVELNGGKDVFVKKLNYGFEKHLIHYDNEPAFLAVHGFIYADRPDLTSFWVRQLMTKSFTDKGYPGNDDSGAMSSWYMFSAMGFFPNAGQDIYYLTGPSFKKTKIHLSNGRVLTIEAPNASPQNIYIKSILVNGVKWQGNIITHNIIQKGGTIVFEMTNKL
ncbi:glycoside hydrolase family 92 protein [Pedobacter frigiditerrae]|uniref:Glycoside hydrolase family 92 protein n=1 Tax=Pedobacter frigiditerrae TaxID=2530452 RepID=A0A4R0MRU3_9SPHI|nr:GH92 family glycosyl hydrolase [Pedobacter frigiditerrae]TCC88744.1 glycoside hydrolase family 92 protein [Pedobacter frigiditerrae]